MTDFNKTFDQVSHSHLMYKIQYCGITPTNESYHSCQTELRDWSWMMYMFLLHTVMLYYQDRRHRHLGSQTYCGSVMSPKSVTCNKQNMSVYKLLNTNYPI